MDGVSNISQNLYSLLLRNRVKLFNLSTDQSAKEIIEKINEIRNFILDHNWSEAIYEIETIKWGNKKGKNKLINNIINAYINLIDGFEYIKHFEPIKVIKLIEDALGMFPDSSFEPEKFEAHTTCGILYNKLGEKEKSDMNYSRAWEYLNKSKAMHNELTREIDFERQIMNKFSDPTHNT